MSIKFTAAPVKSPSRWFVQFDMYSALKGMSQTFQRGTHGSELLCFDLFQHVRTQECEGVVKQHFPASQTVSRETRRALTAIYPLCGLTLLCCWEWKGFRGYPPLRAASSAFSVQSHHTAASSCLAGANLNMCKVLYYTKCVKTKKMTHFHNHYFT